MKKSIIGLASTIFVTTCVSCTQPNSGFAKGYCDDEGCFQCLDGDCSPVQNLSCSGDGDCGDGTSCTSIGCARPCSDDEVCSAGERCVDGFCAPFGFGAVIHVPSSIPCQDDGYCPADQYCGTAGKCVPRCKSDDECGPDLVCIPCGKCQPKTEPASCGSKAVFCSEGEPCGEGKQCKDQRCHLTCDETGDASQCPVGQICAGGGLCVDDPVPADPECALDLHCDGGVCINGYCHARCDSSAQCPGVGSLCQMGACRPDYNPVK